MRAFRTLQMLGRIRGVLFYLCTPVWITNSAILRQLVFARSINAFEERAIRPLDPHQKISAIETLIQHSPQILTEIIIMPSFQHAITLQQTPYDEWNLLR